MKNILKIFLLFIAIGLLTLSGLAFYKSYTYYNELPEINKIINSIILVYIIALIIIAIQEYCDKKEINIFYKNIKNNNQKKEIEILELMMLNMKEIKDYYIMSKSMAKKSFTLSVTMCIFGFIIILTSIISIFIIDISFVQSIVPIICGTVVELIAGTSLVVYKKSLEQLNHYYESLHNNERFLSLVNLVDKLADAKKDEIYINIINSQLEKLK